MSRLHGAWLVCAAATWAVAVGCQGIDSSVYREGAIQSGYRSAIVRSAAGRPDSPGKKLVLGVRTFTESRRHKKEKHALWLCAVPVGSLWAFWERPDWLLWQGAAYAGYKPAGKDLAELLAPEIGRSGLFKSVVDESAVSTADLLLEGDIEDLTLIYRPTFYGTSILIGPLLGSLGVPMGDWAIRQRVSLRLIEAESGRQVWARTFQTADKGPIAAYYGRDPMRSGYPAEELAVPVVEGTLGGLEKMLVARGASYWEGLAARRDRPIVEPPPPPPPSDRSSVALVVGIEDYMFMGRVPGCHADARNVARSVQRARGLGNSRVVRLTEQAAEANKPPREALKRRIHGVAGEAREGGMLFFYFSGH
ncbi:MAG: caspase family protein, partial [Candidatus Brocadiia bacterium]|nr:caspase family protein [Candidatus Brocadiia bacterium]